MDGFLLSKAVISNGYYGLGGLLRRYRERFLFGELDNNSKDGDRLRHLCLRNWRFAGVGQEG